MNKDAKIYVAGHTGLVGSALVRALRASGHLNLVLYTRQQLDLTNQRSTHEMMAAERPDFVLIAAAKVGGILANSDHKADFITENLEVQSNLIRSAHDQGVKKLLFLGSSCIYPRLAPQPIREEYLLQGSLEPTNDAYAVAKIAGIMMCQAYRAQHGSHFIAAMPTNLYGPNDNFDLKSSHVIPAMMRKFHVAKVAGDAPVTLWGNGLARREFLHVDDLASASLFLMEHYDEGEVVNVGTGYDLTIRELAVRIQQVVGHRGEIVWDDSKPNGMPRKLLDVSRMTHLGWSAATPLDAGLRDTYAWFLAHC